MRLQFTPRAIADLEAIADYVQPRSSQGAVRVRAAILGSLQRLLQFPGSGRRQTVETVRKITIRKYKYLVYYRIDDGAEEIVVISIQSSLLPRVFTDG